MTTKPAHSPSLQLRLLSGTLAAVATIWIVLSLVAWREAVHEAEELFDAHLAQTAAMLAGFVGNTPEEIGEHLPAHRYTRRVAFQVWDAGGRLLAHSQNASAQRLSPADAGFSDVAIDGQDWRVYSLRDETQNQLIQVAEAQEARRSVSRELAAHLLAPLAIALPLLALALIMLIRNTLAPLARLAESIGQRSPERLDAIPLADVPRELHPIIGRLNDLLDQLCHSLEQERRFTADAAHELRTPLAAMRAHAQVARSSQGGEERERALDCVIEATDRTTHLVEQLLTLTRLDAASLTGRFTACDLRQIAAEALAQVAPDAFAKAIEISLTEGSPLYVHGDATLLGILLRNLVDNAVRYSPVGGLVDVSLATAPGGDIRLEVVDNGPGIPLAERPRVLERFTRIAGTQGGGSGLGLSIVERIVELHHARFELADGPEGKGLCARVVFRAGN